MTKINLTKDELKNMISELEQKEYELSREIEGINLFLEQCPARKYVNLVQKNGWHKGEIKELTPKQFREIMGYDPPKAIQKPNGNVYWEYTFDQLAKELGYESDEALKAAIEDCADAMKKVRQLKNDLKHVKANLKELRGNKVKEDSQEEQREERLELDFEPEEYSFWERFLPRMPFERLRGKFLKIL